MLKFDDHFVPDGIEGGLLGSTLWTSEPRLGRVRFHLDRFILVDVLHGGNPACQVDNLKLCESWRPRIEKACRRAFARDQADRVEVRPIDFR